MGNVFHKRYRVSRQPFPTPAVSEQKRGRSPEGTLPIRSFERDVCLRALGKCGQYCRDPDYPPQLFPDPTVCRVGKRRTAGCGNQDFRERLAYQSQHRLYHVQPRCPYSYTRRAKTNHAPVLQTNFLCHHTCDRLHSSDTGMDLYGLSVQPSDGRG